jgi:hypothetical protein
MLETPKRTLHHYDAREFHGSPLREPLFFLGFIAPPPACSGVDRNVAAAAW